MLDVFIPVALGQTIDLAVDATALRIPGEERLFVQEGFEVQIRVFADQFQIEAKGLADASLPLGGEHLNITLKVIDRQAEVRFVGEMEHPLSFLKAPSTRGHTSNAGVDGAHESGLYTMVVGGEAAESEVSYTLGTGCCPYPAPLPWRIFSLGLPLLRSAPHSAF
jgi:hypothetical protein